MKKQYGRLEGGRILLEPFSERHITERYIGWFNDPVACRDNRHGQGDYDLQKAKEYYKSVSAAEGVYPFAIFEKAQNRHIGNITLGAVSRANRSAEIAILIGERDAWGKGLGYEACLLVLQFAFNDLDLHRLRMGMTVRNQAMIRICEKLGMTQEGIFRDALRKEDAYLDIVQFACINPKHSESLKA